MGVKDQRNIELREDVLVYTSAPLERVLEVTGNVIATIWASSSARGKSYSCYGNGPLDTDFSAKLVCVHKDGYARNLCDGKNCG
jgi:predicted acyl esterase